MTGKIKIGNIIIAAILGIFSLIALQAIFSSGFVFNSDTLAFTAMYRDLIWYHYPLSGWTLSGASYYFPEIIYHFIVYYLTNSFAIALFTYQIVELSLLTLVFIIINKKIYGDQYLYTIVPILLLITFIITINIIPKIPLLMYNTIRPYCHLSCWVGTLLFLYLIFLYWHRLVSWWLYLFLFLLSLVLTISDNLFLPSLIIPLLFTVAFFQIKKIKIPSTLIIVILAGGIFGFFYSYFFLPPAPINLSLNLQIVKNFLQTVPVFLFHDFIYFTFIWLLTLGLLLYFTYQLIFRTQTIRHQLENHGIHPEFFLFLIFFAVCNLLFLFSSTLITNQFSSEIQGIGAYRYIALIFYLPIFIGLSYFCVILSKYVKQNYFLLIMSVLCIAFLTRVIFSSNLLTLNMNWLRYYSPIAACIDNHSKELITPYGLSGYWTSGSINIYSKNNEWVNSIQSDGKIQLWLNNQYWYLQNKANKKQMPEYSYVILDSTIADNIQNVFGKADKIVACNSDTNDPRVLAYKKYNQIADSNALGSKILIYNKPSSIANLNKQFLQRNIDFFKNYTPSLK